MAKIKRQIIRIDEDKCDGCGKCILACQEGAIQIIDGKARLVGEIYCDGAGACLSVCPQDAITIEVREAEEFDPSAVERRKKELEQKKQVQQEAPCACPSSSPVEINRQIPAGDAGEKQEGGAGQISYLSNWPVQIKLVPVKAGYLENADILICADCVPFAYPDLHLSFIKGRKVLVGCSKLDDAEFYELKLAQIFIQNSIKSIEVVYMEVPCCFGMVHLVKKAIERSERQIPLRTIKVSIKGEILESIDYNEKRS